MRRPNGIGKSKYGATIRLVLPFLLLCALVAIILRVVLPDTGADTQQEQQLYLAVSSALELVCDDLQSATYTGAFAYTEFEEDVGDTGRRTVRHYEQQEGTYECMLQSLLWEDFDKLFGERLRQDVDALEEQNTDKDAVRYESQVLDISETGLFRHTLTITPHITSDPDDLCNQPVEVTVDVVPQNETDERKIYTIEVTATLQDYQMNAELAAAASEPTLQNAERVEGNLYEASMTWELAEVTTGGKGQNGESSRG
jgi:hypothetical protein